jgi:Trypsin
VGRDPDCASSGFCAPSPVNHAVSHAIVHPEYTSGQYHHDIALLVLRTPINFTVAAQPICLHPDRADLTVGKRAMIMGWGKMSTTGQQRSPQMQFLDVPLASWESCVRVYQSTGALDSSQSIGRYKNNVLVSH